MQSFFTKRILKVFIPYLFSLCVWLIYKYLMYGAFDVPNYLMTNNIGHWLPNTWFVWVIIASYFVYWGIFQLNIRLGTKLILMIVLSVGYYVISDNFGIAPYWYRSSLCIALGMTWRFYEEQVIKFLENSKVYYIFPVICIGLFVVCQKIHFKDITPLFTCAVFSWIKYSLKYPMVHKGISFLSKISYEGYLLQCIAIKMVCDFTTRTIFAVPLIFILDIILSYLVFTLSSKIHTSICSVKCK